MGKQCYDHGGAAGNCNELCEPGYDTCECYRSSEQGGGSGLGTVTLLEYLKRTSFIGREIQLIGDPLFQFVADVVRGAKNPSETGVDQRHCDRDTESEEGGSREDDAGTEMTRLSGFMDQSCGRRCEG